MEKVGMEGAGTIAGYNEIVLRHYRSPSNVGEIKDPDGLGEYISDICGDVIRLYLKVSNDRITDAKFQCFGCVGSVACGSVLTEIILGKEVKAAETVGETDILDALGGLSEEKGHCATLAIGALRQAIEGYRKIRYRDST